MLFGMSECARAREAVDCLVRQDMKAFGELMNISHEGERCFRVGDDLQAVPWHAEVTNGYLEGLISDLESDDPARRERAQLHCQPGAYHCSIREVDALADIAMRTPGVLGAQIAGAGLGGCAMVLVENGALTDLEARLNKLFYERQGLAPGLYVCTPAAGSRIVSVEA
jgi:galactokinase